MRVFTFGADEDEEADVVVCTDAAMVGTAAAVGALFATGEAVLTTGTPLATDAVGAIVATGAAALATDTAGAVVAAADAGGSVAVSVPVADAVVGSVVDAPTDAAVFCSACLPIRVLRPTKAPTPSAVSLRFHNRFRSSMRGFVMIFVLSNCPDPW